MNRKTLAALLVVASLFAAACQQGANQTAANGAANGSVNGAPGAPGAAGAIGGGAGGAVARDVLVTFPDSKALGYVNIGRIFKEALPAAGVPQAELDKMYADMQRGTEGFDVRSIDTVMAGIRYTEPLSKDTMPEFLVVAKGSFNAADLIGKMKAKSKNPIRQEDYKGRTLEIMSTSNPGNPSSRPEPYPEIAVTSFDSGTIVGGVPAYVRAAIDAADGGPRVRTELIDLVTRNSADTLISFAGDVPPSLADLIRGAGGMGGNPEAERAFRAIRQLQFSIGMNPTDYTLNTLTRTDTPDNATWMSSTVTTQLGQFRTMLEGQLNQARPDQVEQMQLVLAVLRSVNVSASGNEVRFDMNIPVNTVRTLVQKQMNRGGPPPPMTP